MQARKLDGRAGYFVRSVISSKECVVSILVACTRENYNRHKSVANCSSRDDNVKLYNRIDDEAISTTLLDVQVCYYNSPNRTKRKKAKLRKHVQPPTNNSQYMHHGQSSIYRTCAYVEKQLKLKQGLTSTSRGIFETWTTPVRPPRASRLTSTPPPWPQGGSPRA